MAKTETSTNGFFDVTKAFGDLRLPGLDVEAIVATQRKNLEALTQAKDSRRNYRIGRVVTTQG